MAEGIWNGLSSISLQPMANSKMPCKYSINAIRNYSNMEILNATCEQIIKFHTIQYSNICFRVLKSDTIKHWKRVVRGRNVLLLFVKGHVINHRYANDAKQMYCYLPDKPIFNKYISKYIFNIFLFLFWWTWTKL